MFEQAFRNIDDVLRKEAGCTTELDYTEQSSWLLFLKYLDSLEEDKATEAKLDGKKHAYILDKPYRWETWAAPKDKDGQLDHNKAMTGDDLRDFVNIRLFPYLCLKNDLHDHFSKIPKDDYLAGKASIEELVTTQMTYKMDERVVDFFENHRNDARTLAGVISKKQRFDKASFEKLKHSFPCILAGIRDFAEYIPLESEIFDLVILDEASQVSIAQAFPALLRGKKIIVLGDKKQFSNVKSAQARSDNTGSIFSPAWNRL